MKKILQQLLDFKLTYLAPSILIRLYSYAIYTFLGNTDIHCILKNHFKKENLPHLSRQIATYLWRRHLIHTNLLYIGIDGPSVTSRDIIPESHTRPSRTRGRQGGGDNLGNASLREAHGSIYIQVCTYREDCHIHIYYVHLFNK